MKEKKDTKVVAFRLESDEEKTLLSKAKPDESKSEFMRRVVKTFLKRK